MGNQFSLADQMAPVVVEEAPIDLVRVEKSLHSLGFFASTTNQQASRTVTQIFRRPDGQRIQARAVIEGIPSLGLPTTADRDKYMAFMKIALDQREAMGKIENPIHFTGSDMIKLLRLRKGGFHYDEINDWCKRMVATTIMSESSIFIADRRQFASDTFHVFDRVVLVGEELGDGTRSEHYQVYLSHWQLTNLNQGYLLPLDFNAYLRLRRDISKALFGHLSVWFYASRGQTIEKRYQDLCQLMNIRAYPHLSKASSVLGPSLDELVEIGYLSEWELTRMARGADFKLVLTPGRRLLTLPTFSNIVNPEARAALDATLPSWVNDLVTRGVAERKARQLALDIPEHQPVLDQIEYAEHLIAQDRKGRSKISNPVGFILWTIEQNLVVPEDFETSERRRCRQAAESEQAEMQWRTVRLEEAYQQFCRDEAKLRMKEYSEEQLEMALRDHMKVIKREQLEWFSRIPAATQREVAMSRLQTALLEEASLPSFEAWRKSQSQQSLFFD
jgi:hypothetical protein